MKRFIAVFFARNLEFIRDKGTFFWNLFFPILLIFGFAFAFSGNNDIYKIGFIGKKNTNIEFLQYKYLKFIEYQSIDEAKKKLEHHQIDMLLNFTNNNYFINSEEPKGYIVEKMLMSDKTASFTKNIITGQRIRYVDWVVPGIIGMNIMFGCLLGVGFVIIRYRKNGVLKRFKATPLSAFEFISAQLFSRFFIMMCMCTVVFAGVDFFLHLKMEGSYLDLIIITAIAILCHISLGLLFSTRIKSEELGGGLINVLIFPMMFLSGIWFSLEGTPRIMQNASKIFPITHFIEAARKIMLDGADLLGVMNSLVTLITMTLVFLVIAAFIFKWE